MHKFCACFLNRSEFRQKLMGYVIKSYAGKNAYSAGKTNGVLRGGASGANRCYVLAHTHTRPPTETQWQQYQTC